MDGFIAQVISPVFVLMIAYRVPVAIAQEGSYAVLM